MAEVLFPEVSLPRGWIHFHRDIECPICSKQIPKTKIFKRETEKFIHDSVYTRCPECERCFFFQVNLSSRFLEETKSLEKSLYWGCQYCVHHFIPAQDSPSQRCDICRDRKIGQLDERKVPLPKFYDGTRHDITGYRLFVLCDTCDCHTCSGSRHRCKAKLEAF